MSSCSRANLRSRDVARHVDLHWHLGPQTRLLTSATAQKAAIPLCRKNMALAALCATHRALLPILSFAVFEPHYRSGAIPWCHIEKTFPIESIVDQTARQFRLEHRLAQRYVSEMLGMWRRLGLLDGERKHSALIRTSGPPREMWNESRRIAASQVSDHERWRRYRPIDTDFSLGFSDVLLEEIIAPVLLHLETPLSGVDAEQLRIVMEGGRLDVWHIGMWLGS